MSDKYFIDTNIFIYCFDSDSSKKKIAHGLIQEGLISGSSRISFQVIQEFCNVATRKFEKPFSPSELSLYIDEILAPQCVNVPTIDQIKLAISIQNDSKFSFYDSTIISAALHANCKILYSDDLQHNQKIQGLNIINPFKT